MMTTQTRHAGFAGLMRASLPAVAALLLGTFVIFGVGFAGPGVIHNAAHDSRHAFAFPCH